MQSLIRWRTEGFTKECFETFHIYVKVGAQERTR
jgi:hypothetical protein